MTWTYGADPENSNLDAVRLIIGDTDSNNPLLQDEEINYYLTKYETVTKAAYHATMGIVAKLSILHRQETGKIKIWANEKWKQYMALAKQLQDDMRSGISSTPEFFAGGISHTDMNTRNSDPDQVQVPISELLNKYKRP